MPRALLGTRPCLWVPASRAALNLHLCMPYGSPPAIWPTCHSALTDLQDVCQDEFLGAQTFFGVEVSSAADASAVQVTPEQLQAYVDQASRAVGG